MTAAISSGKASQRSSFDDDGFTHHHAQSLDDEGLTELLMTIEARRKFPVIGTPLDALRRWDRQILWIRRRLEVRAAEDALRASGALGKDAAFKARAKAEARVRYLDRFFKIAAKMLPRETFKEIAELAK